MEAGRKISNNKFAEISSEMDNAKQLLKTDRLVVKSISGKKKDLRPEILNVNCLKHTSFKYNILRNSHLLKFV
jgi:hypothetical protein